MRKLLLLLLCGAGQKQTNLVNYYLVAPFII